MLNTSMCLLLGWCHIMYRELCNILFSDRSLSQWATLVESKIKFEAFKLHRPLKDNDGISGLRWRLLLLHDRRTWHWRGFAGLLITGPKHLSLRTFYQRIFELCFCQDTVQTYSCNTMQFTGACHRESIKTPLFLDLLGAVTWSRDSLANHHHHHDHISQQ